MERVVRKVFLKDSLHFSFDVENVQDYNVRAFRIITGVEPRSAVFPALAGRFFTTVPLGKPIYNLSALNIFWG